MDKIIKETLSAYGTVQLHGDWRGYTVQITDMPVLTDNDITTCMLLLEDYGYEASIQFGEQSAIVHYIRKNNTQLFDFDHASDVWKRETGANDPKRLKKQQQRYWAMQHKPKRKRKKPKRYTC